ncbi:phosphate ABC transporter permease subunit PstC [Nereida ignava]|uniref:Phosphate transport system permease protein n=1 Tax=Nereida ignava TaxID=282199 RepID=A0A0U1NIC4_9RHOB|nr:phosphate ABC transporter permease subunit PstC [Nereida ignava]CRK74223.1 Phosphate transport system permease protein PstC [Nereida ignava]SFJ43733.1 phosphate ABC transporter membrane protein 1, PhoT family (TC 3.A.1.7.1) [Nereida ignava DSM 16309]
MSGIVLLLIVLGLGALAFILARGKALSSVGGDQRALHSRPHYYGFSASILTIAPAVALMVVWGFGQSTLVQSSVAELIPASAIAEGQTVGLLMGDVQRIANGLDTAVAEGALSSDAAATLSTGADDIRGILGSVGVALGADVDPAILKAAQSYRAMQSSGATLRMIAVIGVALLGLTYGFMQTSATYRARNSVERSMRWTLIAAASVAVFTTLGIVFSVIFNTIEFFQLYPAKDFFLSLTWSPSFGGGSELGVFPLLWGTLYISLIALMVAVPTGLFSAIYLSEYASPKVRAFAKPLLEVLAGIPTIVYGLFALLTVGPLLVNVFGDGGILGVNWMQGGTAVMTAGLVMGIMLIPFVSSLSDDIINAVPQALRDGSLGLGATPSETIRQVVIPAALPGIVGAILLAASRAIGETMIVVLGAGAAARLSMNPFDAMTTVTAKIVSQLTGDADFASPEALVAFALAMTLFVITLGLNVIALGIVRKYREQYE